MIAYGNPGSGRVHRNTQRVYDPLVAAAEKAKKKEAKKKKPRNIKPVIVDGRRYANCEAAAKFLGSTGPTVKRHANEGTPLYGHSVKWGDTDAA
jgi:hypothetical protein